MTAPCESDPATLTLELEAAWSAYNETLATLRIRTNEATQYRRLHFRQQPCATALDQIGRCVMRAHAGADLGAVIQDIEKIVTETRTRVEHIRRAQEKQKS